MLGGILLLTSIGAMLYLAWWAAQYDDLPDADARGGLLPWRNAQSEIGKTKSASRRGNKPHKTREGRSGRRTGREGGHMRQGRADRGRRGSSVDRSRRVETQPAPETNRGEQAPLSPPRPRPISENDPPARPLRPGRNQSRRS